MRKNVFWGIMFCLCLILILPNFADAKSFKNHLNSIGNYLNQARYGQLVDNYAKAGGSGYLIGTFMSEGHYYPKSILRNEIMQTDYLVLKKKVLTKNQWNSFFTKVSAKKRGVVLTRKVPTCSCNPEAVVFQVIKRNNGVVTLKGYLESHVGTLEFFGLL